MGILFHFQGTTQKSHHDVFCHQYPAPTLFDDANAQNDDDDNDVDDGDDDQNPEKNESMFIFIYHSKSLV